MKATIVDLQAAIVRERDYQDAKWGTPQDNPHSLAGWLLIAEGELDEAMEAWRRGKGDTEAKAELLQMVAVGCAWLEQRHVEIYGYFVSACAYDEHRPFEEWLGIIKALYFPKAWQGVYLYFSPERSPFTTAIEMGMVALLQHGIVERHELETPQTKCPVCDKPSISGKRPCNQCRLKGLEADKRDMGLLS